MVKTMGKPITREELQKVLDREKSKEERRKQFFDELKGIKPGECLLYEAEQGAGALASFGMAGFIGKIAGLKMVTECDRTYVYRE